MSYPDESTPMLLLLVLATRRLADALQVDLVDAGFVDHRVVHHNVMAHVTHEGTRLTELAEKSGITKQAMSELVIDLERLGYLHRRPDPVDGRAKLIGFTDKGRSAVHAAMGAFERIDAILDQRLGPDTRRLLRQGLLTLLDTPLSPTKVDDEPHRGDAAAATN